jgi:hypothetical protein
MEERPATEPGETLFVAEDRQNADRVLELGFQYADAAATILNLTGVAPTNPVSANMNGGGLPMRPSAV